MGVKISELTSMGTLAGTEKIAGVDSGTQYTTPADLATYCRTVGTSPVGSYIQHAGATAPTGFLACDGSAVSRTTYASLFAVISTTYGAGDGSTTFNLPDARGLVMVGAGSHGTMTRADASAYNGGTVGATRNDQMQGHRHSPLSSATNFFSSDGGSGVGYAGGNTILSSLTTGGPVTDGTNGTPRTGNETRPAEIAVLVCIKY